MKTALALLGLAALAAAAHAQPGRPDEHRYGPRVTVYENANYKGDELTFFAGDEVVDLSQVRFRNGAKLNDAISSIRVSDGLEVLIFEHHRFEGLVFRTTTDVRNLADRRLPDVKGTWNDRASSLVVRFTRGGGGRPGPGYGNGRPPARPEPINPDPIIDRAYRDLLNREPDPEGRRHFRGLILDQGWTERMVRDHLRKSDEYRGSGVDGIIRRAYRDLLGRDPDPDGLGHYRRKLLDDDWSEEQLRSDLKRSREYRDRRK